MLLVIVAMVVIDQYNANDDDWQSENVLAQMHTVKISNNETIQKAYQQCRINSMSQFLSDNRHLSKEELNMTLPYMPDTCKDVILSSCKSHDPNDKSCKFGLMSINYKTNS